MLLVVPWKIPPCYQSSCIHHVCNEGNMLVIHACNTITILLSRAPTSAPLPGPPTTCWWGTWWGWWCLTGSKQLMITRSNVLFVSVCDFLLFLGKLVVVLICGSASYFAFCGYIPQIKVHWAFLLLQLIGSISDFDPESELSLCPSGLHHRRQLHDRKVGLFLNNKVFGFWCFSAASSLSTPWPWTPCSSASWRTWRGMMEHQRSLTTCLKAWGKFLVKWIRLLGAQPIAWWEVLQIHQTFPPRVVKNIHPGFIVAFI